MRFFQRAPDGGKDSGVDGLFIVEIKSLFSIVLLRFQPRGKRENFHSHAFNALTLWLGGSAEEETLCSDRNGEAAVKRWCWGRGWRRLKWTPRRQIHRYQPWRTTYCLTVRGPWQDTWKEVSPEGDIITLTHGRQELYRVRGAAV